jgi:hypothetical protein
MSPSIQALKADLAAKQDWLREYGSTGPLSTSVRVEVRQIERELAARAAA